MFKVDCDKLAQWIWSIAKTGTGVGTFDIWEEYDPSIDDEPYDCYRVEIIKIAATTMVLIVYYGGGYAWSYEFGNDMDSSGLRACLRQIFLDLNRKWFWAEE